jgi:hypothetical protein
MHSGVTPWRCADLVSIFPFPHHAHRQHGSFIVCTNWVRTAGEEEEVVGHATIRKLHSAKHWGRVRKVKKLADFYVDPTNMPKVS